MRRTKLLIALSSAGSLAVLGTALGGAAHAGAPTTVVTTKKSAYGTILATSSGRTLYLDSGDKPPHFACTGGCLQAWPPLLAKGTVKAAGSAKASLLRTVKGPRGTIVTYHGHPLYTFISDTKSSQTNGEGQTGFEVVDVAGNAVTKKTTTTTTSTSSTGKKPTSTTPGY
jgi:predicted lipoprotein with Yx(FWY)xxD motif